MIKFDEVMKKILIGVLVIATTVVITFMLMDRVEEIENNPDAYTNRSIEVIK